MRTVDVPLVTAGDLLIIFSWVMMLHVIDSRNISARDTLILTDYVCSSILFVRLFSALLLKYKNNFQQ